MGCYGKIFLIIFFGYFLQFGFLSYLLVDGNPPTDINNLQYTFDFKYQENIPQADSKTFFIFFQNIHRFYLNLVPSDNLAINIIDGKKNIILNDSRIYLKQQVKMQLVEHFFTVNIDKINNKLVWVSKASKIHDIKWNIDMKVAIISVFQLKNNDITVNITTGFGSKRDLIASKIGDTQKDWREHNEKEIRNAILIYKYLLKTKQIYNNPDTWNIDEIKSLL